MGRTTRLTREEFARQYFVMNNGRAVFCRCETCNKTSHYDINTAMAAVEHDAPLHCPHCDSWTVSPERREQNEDIEEAPHASLS